MAITQETHWDDVGIEPGAGDAEYTAGQQPIAEYDNWFNWSAAKDVENLIAALENVATGHDHDGANSKKVDGSDVVNTPAGTIVATDVQAAIDELDGDITNHVGDASDAHDASAISNIPAGSIAATDVQAAIDELDTEKEKILKAITSLSADTTLDSTHHTVGVDASGAAKVITLPAAAVNTGRIYNISKRDSSANTVTIDANAAELINGAATVIISTQYGSYTIQSDGTGWWVI